MPAGRQVALTLLQLRGHTVEEDTLSDLSDQEVVDLLDIRSGLEWATPRASTPRALATASAGSASGIHDASASGVEGAAAAAAAAPRPEETPVAAAAAAVARPEEPLVAAAAPRPEETPAAAADDPPEDWQPEEVVDGHVAAAPASGAGRMLQRAEERMLQRVALST